MSNLTACQPGWVAVFLQVDGNGYTTEPVACWLLREDGKASDPDVHPICALGGDVCDAKLVANYIGVIPPYADANRHRAAIRQLVEDAKRDPIKNTPTAA